VESPSYYQTNTVHSPSEGALAPAKAKNEQIKASTKAKESWEAIFDI